MKTHLIHGFNVKDGGRSTVGNLRPYFPAPIVHSVGLVGLLDMRCKNKAVVKSLAPLISSDDILVGHSNGALIIWRLLQAGVRPRAVVVFNAALRRDTLWPSGVPVLCLHSSKDWTVQLGRAWSRLVSLGGLTPHGWGAAGRYGFNRGQSNVDNVDMSESYYIHPVSSHSGALRAPAVDYWGEHAAGWLSSIVRPSSI